MANKRTAGSSPPDSPANTQSEASNSSKASSSAESGRGQIDFQFLNFSHPSEAKASRARRAVRSHVTRQQHQREHALAAARRAQSYQQPVREPEPEQSAPKRRPHASTFPQERPTTLDLKAPTAPPSSSQEGSSASPSPAASPGIPERRLDPLALYPEAWHPYIPLVIEHYLANTAVDIPDLDGPEAKGLLRTRFFPFVLTDPASLHAVMLMASSHYGSAQGPKSHTIDLLQLRGIAIREINAALGDPTRATSDQVIAAVANMAAYEALFGDHANFNTHMAGLLRLVSLRGGLPALGLNGLLQHILLWIDSNASQITGQRLYFDRLAFPSSALHPRPDPARFAGLQSGAQPG